MHDVRRIRGAAARQLHALTGITLAVAGMATVAEAEEAPTTAVRPALNNVRPMEPDTARYVDGNVPRGAQAPTTERALRTLRGDVSFRRPPSALPPAEVALFEALSARDTTAARAAIAKGARGSVRDGATGLTGLTAAIDAQDAEVVEGLLERRADPMLRDGRGRSPLALAALRGHPRIVEMLLRAGARIDVRGDDGLPPLAAAVLADRVAAVDLLIARGADVAQRDARGHPPLVLAAQQGHVGSARRLLAAGAAVDGGGQDGLPPLYWAVLRRHRAVAELLVAAGANAGTISLDALD
ncbi:MAG: ankyrin repeat domain-containing protein [Burkholderiales bacterium]|nr:ankyrin repeat domain-containing protein [Burkholderiales bacterium]